MGTKQLLSMNEFCQSSHRAGFTSPVVFLTLDSLSPRKHSSCGGSPSALLPLLTETAIYSHQPAQVTSNFVLFSLLPNKKKKKKNI